MSKNPLTDVPFSRFDLPVPISQGIEEAGFVYCTPIQSRTLPLVLAGRDVAGQAQTGTGKTAAFLIATLNHLLRHPRTQPPECPRPRALILAPTRELAIQIHRDAEVLNRHCGLRLGLAYGGTGYESQRETLKAGVDILIGTPGRIIDYFKQHVFDLKDARVVVLDEADRMFDLGFIRDIRFLLRHCPAPEQRLSLLFSATLSFRVMELAYEHMNNPELVQVEPEKLTVDQVRQRVYYTANEDKIPLLLGLLGHMDPRRSIIFVNTKRDAERVERYLEANGFHAGMLSGDVPQQKRQHLLAQFLGGNLPVLVATDVAARGLHIPDVTHVFNFDLPQDAEDYVHRIGRTARLGAEGDAISFACERYAYSLPDIENYIGQKIPREPVEPAMLVTPIAPARRERRPHEAGRGGDPQRRHRTRSSSA
ncbi:ATP-dependent RNA helicase RhlB [bacterium BMS3Bbin12]|nr:ATP-dependent RNA helicase RhlB [bacterium BMS3Abin12]GBE46975.1 ATP-dependent RNA helicase RhlB [bacterium BMS3Bbin12]GBE50311.1 ATP-dependent RNA helicase RhlB [bacterium BMS3Bbin13]